LSRSPQAGGDGVDWMVADLATGAGLEPAVQDVDAVVHAASDPADPAGDVSGTERLARLAGGAGVRHLLFVSIVGIDRIPLPYYQSKLAAERALETGGAVPWSILRASQFHWLVDMMLSRLAFLPGVLPVPAGFRVQSIGTPDVAAVLCDALAGPARGRLPDLAGPEPMSLARAARIWTRATGRRLVLPVPALGRVAAGFRAGYNTVPERPSGTERWSEWLERRAG